MNERVVNIPERLILDKDLGEMRALVYAGLVFTKWSPDRNIGELVSFIGYKPEAGTGRTNHKIKQVMNNLVASGYMDSSFRQIDCGEFATISFDKFKALIAYRADRGSRISHDRILLLMAYLEYNMRHCLYDDCSCSCTTRKISTDTGLNSRFIQDYIDVLECLNVIRSERVPRIMDSYGQWYTNLRFFVEATSRTNPNYDPRTALEKAKHNFINRW